MKQKDTEFTEFPFELEVEHFFLFLEGVDRAWRADFGYSAQEILRRLLRQFGPDRGLGITGYVFFPL